MSEKAAPFTEVVIRAAASGHDLERLCRPGIGTRDRHRGAGDHSLRVLDCSRDVAAGFLGEDGDDENQRQEEDPAASAHVVLLDAEPGVREMLTHFGNHVAVFGEMS